MILILLLIARQGYTYVDIGLEQAGPEKEEQEEIGELENLMRANFLVVADELEQDSEEVGLHFEELGQDSEELVQD